MEVWDWFIYISILKHSEDPMTPMSQPLIKLPEKEGNKCKRARFNNPWYCWFFLELWEAGAALSMREVPIFHRKRRFCTCRWTRTWFFQWRWFLLSMVVYGDPQPCSNDFLRMKQLRESRAIQTVRWRPKHRRLAASYRYFEQRYQYHWILWLDQRSNSFHQSLNSRYHPSKGSCVRCSPVWCGS